MYMSFKGNYMPMRSNASFLYEYSQLDALRKVSIGVGFNMKEILLAVRREHRQLYEIKAFMMQVLT